jgi:hypothetical protein
MADYSDIRALFDGRNTNYYTFHPKSDKSIKAVIRNLPIETPVEDICNGLSELGFSVMSVRQLTSNGRSPEGDNQRLPLFLITLQKTAKSTEIFKLTNLCHMIIKVESYRARNKLTQFFNCQKFGHIAGICRQPPRCMGCGGSHIHKECPETNNRETSIPHCCNCQLKDGERPHPSNYRGCSHAKEELQRKRMQRPSNSGQEARKFSPEYVVPGKSFAAALDSNPKQQQPPVVTAEAPTTTQNQQQNTGLSVAPPNVNSQFGFRARHSKTLQLMSLTDHVTLKFNN